MGKFILNEAREASFKLLEGEVKPGVLASVEGIGAWCDESTNGREYTESLFEKAFNHPTYAYEMAHGGVLGEADHPKGRDDTVYSEASHIVRKSWVENGEVHLIIDILNTPKGQVLYTILRAGKPLGISLRALGEYDKTKPGRKIVEDTFELITWDFVTNPGFTDARFAIAESVEREGRMSIEESVDRMIASIGSMSENELKTLEEINKVYDFGDKKEVIEEAIDRKRKSFSAPTNIVRGLNMKVERLEAEATKKDKELEALREENERLVQEAEEGRKRIQELTEANQDLGTRVQIAESKSRNDGSKLVSLVQENLQKASTIKELRCASTESIVESKSRIEALSAELEESNKELTRQRESIAEERERSKKQVQETEESHRKEMKALLEAFGLEGPAVKRILESKNRKGQLVKELTEVEAVQEPTFKPVKVQESKTRSEANQRTSTLLNRIN